jgi:hypothetical protein
MTTEWLPFDEINERPIRAVRWTSVKATLAGNLDGPAPRFVRVAHGRYTV